MEMKFKKYMMLGATAFAMAMTSCVGDLDLEPNDPNTGTPDDSTFAESALAMCYSGIAVSGYSGAGSSYVSGLDAGTSAYLRMIFTLNEFCTDECLWIWSDAGVPDITACTWSANNGLLEGAYYRMLGHIAICNDFLAKTAASDIDGIDEMRAQARVLRAYSYYNMLDLFGQSSFITEEAELGEEPVQKSRKELYEWVESELVDIVDNKLISETPIYGRVGLDGAEGLLARLYLNAEVFSGTAQWQKCQDRCDNIIARHTGKGFNGTGLAKEYLYLFSRDNNAYMPGGSNSDENEILFGIAFDATQTQSYGGPSFIISSTITNSHYIPRQLYGSSAEWSCLRGCQEMANRFVGLSDVDKRDDLWIRGNLPGGTTADGTKYEAENYSDHFEDFTGAWNTCGGNAIIKFTGNTRNPNKPETISQWQDLWDMQKDASGNWQCNFPATAFASTDQPIIRLADIYLMWAECYINGNAGSAETALRYMNYVRERAGSPAMGFANLNKEDLMDERSREFYLESLRRTDLIRNGMFVGPTQTVWQYKGNIENNVGTRIADKYALYPIPSAVLSSQPSFKQNPGY